MCKLAQGLQQAVRIVLPEAEHRFCARHIYANWGKKYTGAVMRELFWDCAWSTFEERFNDHLLLMKNQNEEAAKALVSYPVKAWVRAFFSNRCLHQMVDNNMAESLNHWIDEFRYVPVLRMFDGIREKLMEKWSRSEAKANRWRGDYSPWCLEMFDVNRGLATRCKVIFNGDDGYEIREGRNRHNVLLAKKMCTCRFWDLTGIPCKHSISAMWHARIDPISEISSYYHKDTYLSTYETKFQPIRGEAFWGIATYEPMLPPPEVVLPGRPTVKRKRSAGESSRRVKAVLYPSRSEQADESINVERLSRAGRPLKCTHCKKGGHNRSTCKEVQLYHYICSL